MPFDPFLTMGDSNRSKLTIDETWVQGRGCFGGLLSGCGLAAMQQHVADDAKRPRSLTVHFCAPAAPGDLAVETRLVRKGSRVTHMTAEIADPNGVCTILSATFAADRHDVLTYLSAERPEQPAPETVVSLPQDLPGVPTFIRNFDMRPTGPFPFTGHHEAYFSSWIRPRASRAIDAPTVAFLLDVPPPGACVKASGPRAIASVDFTIRFFDSFEKPYPDDFVLLTCRSRWAAAGYTQEIRDLWTRDGKLLAQCCQLIALL